MSRPPDAPPASWQEILVVTPMAQSALSSDWNGLTTNLLRYVGPARAGHRSENCRNNEDFGSPFDVSTKCKFVLLESLGEPSPRRRKLRTGSRRIKKG